MSSKNSNFLKSTIVQAILISLANCIILQKGIGEPCSNREFWSQVKLSDDEISQANIVNANPMPPWNDSLYFETARTGNRVNGEAMMFKRTYKFHYMVLTECVFNNGSYMTRIEEYLNGICKQPSWAQAAHDAATNFSYYYGKQYYVELNSGKNTQS